LTVAAALTVLPGSVLALGGDEGGNVVNGGSGGWSDAGSTGDGDCCGFPKLPPELEDRALELERSFFTFSYEDLGRQRWAGTLCENHPCADEVSEDQAKDLLDSFVARQSAKAQAEVKVRDKWWDGFQKIVLGLIAFGGLGLGILNRYRPRNA